MELNDLKSGWQNTGGAFKSENDLQKMTKVTHHPTLKKIRTKLVFETIGLVLFLIVYYDGFDGDQKTFFVNALLISSLLLYILNDVIGYISIAKPIRGDNLKMSIRNYLMRIKRLSVFSLSISFLYGISLLVFFTSVINFTKEKNLILVGFIVALFLMTFLSLKIWTKWIKSLEQQVNDFDLNDEM